MLFQMPFDFGDTVIFLRYKKKSLEKQEDTISNSQHIISCDEKDMQNITMQETIDVHKAEQ